MFVVSVLSLLCRFADVRPSQYQTQLKWCVKTSLASSSSDVRQTVDRISAIVDDSSLGMTNFIFFYD